MEAGLAVGQKTVEVIEEGDIKTQRPTNFLPNILFKVNVPPARGAGG